jgi:hypothetical protein
VAILLAATLALGIERSIYCQRVGGEGDEIGQMLAQRESAFHECALFLRGAEPRYRLARPGLASLPRAAAVELFFGHAVIALGEHPVIASGFGSELESHVLNARLFTLAAPEATALADAEQVQYYFACELPPYVSEGYRAMTATAAPVGERSLNERLMRDLGSGSPTERAVGPWRAVFEPEHRGWVRVFERVPGAVLPVATSPGTPVAIQVRLECAHGHKLAWQDVGRTDAEGHLTLVLPYATADPNGEVRAVEDYRLQVGGNAYFVRVTEAQVRAGETLGGAALRAPR